MLKFKMWQLFSRTACLDAGVEPQHMRHFAQIGRVAHVSGVAGLGRIRAMSAQPIFFKNI